MINDKEIIESKQYAEQLKSKIIEIMDIHFSKPGKFYKLDKDHNAIPCSLMEWNNFFEENDRTVRNDTINDLNISTVFLGINHDIFGGLYIFETMIFDKNGEALHYQERYGSWKEAEEGHEKAIQWVLDGCKE